MDILCSTSSSIAPTATLASARTVVPVVGNAADVASTHRGGA